MAHYAQLTYTSETCVMLGNMVHQHGDWTDISMFFLHVLLNLLNDLGNILVSFIANFIYLHCLVSKKERESDRSTGVGKVPNRKMVTVKGGPAGMCDPQGQPGALGTHAHLHLAPVLCSPT